VREVQAAELTKVDLAKYPFLKAASAYVANLGFSLRDLGAPGLSDVLKRAVERVAEAIRSGRVRAEIRDEDVDILSFPVALALVVAVGNEYLRKRYALAEAKRAEELLLLEPPEKILAVARDLGWEIRPVEILGNGVLYEFSLSVRDYLRTASGMKDKKWKLVNRLVRSGEVLITRVEAARLLSEDIQRRIEGFLDRRLKEVPPVLSDAVERIKGLLAELKLGERPSLELGEVNFEAFPPCMKALYTALSEKRHVPHAGRFAFTAFLLHVGMSVDEIVDLFKQVADFSERITRYQVEHIAGERGGKTRYSPPSCDTMRSYGLCVGTDDLCSRVRHPLTYYARKLRRLRKSKRGGGEGGGENG